MAAFGEHSDEGFRIPGWVFVLALVGGGFYFFQHYGIAGLDQVSIYEKDSDSGEESEVNSSEEFFAYHHANLVPSFDFGGESDSSADAMPEVAAPAKFRSIRVASWALDGFTPSKLAHPAARKNLVRVARQFDLIALQQISSFERDLVPRIVDAINESGRTYDFVLGKTTGPTKHPEQLAFVFDVGRLRVDRSQTYSVEDPTNQLLYDPLVALFQTAQPTPQSAWTFSVVNVRIDLARAKQEVATLPYLLSAVRADGKGEDDVVMAGLFQADDDYLLPTLAGPDVRSAVRSVPTDIFGKHQTSNILVDANLTSEFIGSGGAFDFMRAYELSSAEAETLTSHLPVFAEFTAVEGGDIRSLAVKQTDSEKNTDTR